MLIRRSVLPILAAAMAMGGVALFQGQAAHAEKPVQTAQAGPEAQVAARVDAMKAIGGGLRSLRQALAGGSFGNPADVEALMAHLGTVPDLFPAGTGSDAVRTRAKPEIWAEREAFDAIVARFTAATGTLQGAVSANDVAAARTAAETLGETCSACHTRFRGPAL